MDLRHARRRLVRRSCAFRRGGAVGRTRSLSTVGNADRRLMLGDNAYPRGTDSEYQAAVFDMYPTMLRKSVLWPTFGSHEGRSANSVTQTGPYFDIFTLPRNAEAGGIVSGTEAYYSFDYGNIHFIVLDSFGSDRSPRGPMLSWLQPDLALTTQDWIIAYWHHPPPGHVRLAQRPGLIGPGRDGQPPGRHRPGLHRGHPRHLHHLQGPADGGREHLGSAGRLRRRSRSVSRGEVGACRRRQV